METCKNSLKIDTVDRHGGQRRLAMTVRPIKRTML